MLILSVAPMGLFSIPACAETATNGTTGNCIWTPDGTVLTISGNGAMENYWYSNSLPWGISITEVIINTGVTSIDQAAFSGCSKLENLTINGAERLYENSFSNCNSLKIYTFQRI